MPSITINNQVISFPNSSASPDWSPSLVQFAEAVAAALSTAVNPNDVAPQVFALDSYNSASNVNIPNLAFPTSTVRAVFIHYSVYRATSSANADEAGDMIAIYNPNNSTGLKWSLTQGNITSGTGGGKIAFNVTDTGQFQFSTTPLAGSSHTGALSFDARALAQ